MHFGKDDITTKKRFLDIVAIFVGICFTMAACSSNEATPSVEDDRIAGGSISVTVEKTKENAGEVEKQEDPNGRYEAEKGNQFKQHEKFTGMSQIIIDKWIWVEYI